MKRYIRSTTHRFEKLLDAGYECVDTGYANGKDDYEYIKEKMLRKYGPDMKMYRAASDTPGLMCYEVWTKGVQ